MLRVWNVTLVIVTFFLTIFGTFMTRSGVVQSVHAFGEDRWLAGLFTGFMIVILVFSFAMVIYRLPLLRSRHQLDSWMSREAAFLANNWILLFSAFFVLFATMFPTLSEAVRGQRLTVGPPFFNTWMRPIGLALLLLTGTAPLLAWRKSSAANLLQSLAWPAAGGMVTTAAVIALGIRAWSSVICFGLCAFVGVTILQEFVRGALVRRDTTGSDFFTAMVGLVARSRRRYGGYIVHLGIVLMFLGFAGQGYKLDENFKMNPGQQGTIGGFTIRHDALTVTSDDQKQMITGQVTVLQGDKALAELRPARWFFAKHEDQPTTEVAVRRSAGEDIYVVLAGYEVETQNATYAVTINPLVNWIWLGFGLLAFGTGIALLPERAFAFAGATVPEGAATTTLLLLLLLLPAVGRAQTIVPRSELRKQLEAEVMCGCGGCRAPMNNCQMRPNCHGLNEQNRKLDAFLAQGMNREQVLEAFVADHGGQQDVLAAPLNRGFNRLAWAVPYLVGVSGAALLGLVAVRWTRRDAVPPLPAAAGQGDDPALRERLDDELRDLD